ncbi:MAG: hypothetical protein ACK43N_02795, partial [Pirellulaceae bacterium]
MNRLLGLGEYRELGRIVDYDLLREPTQSVPSLPFNRFPPPAVASLYLLSPSSGSIRSPNAARRGIDFARMLPSSKPPIPVGT